MRLAFILRHALTAAFFGIASTNALAIEPFEEITCHNLSEINPRTLELAVVQESGYFSYKIIDGLKNTVIREGKNIYNCNPPFGQNIVTIEHSINGVTIEGFSVGVCRISTSTGFKLEIVKDQKSSPAVIRSFKVGHGWEVPINDEEFQELSGAVCNVSERQD